jgi:hypothetical protein
MRSTSLIDTSSPRGSWSFVVRGLPHGTRRRVAHSLRWLANKKTQNL